MKMLPMICLATAFAFQSNVAFAELTEDGKTALKVTAGVAGGVAIAQPMGNLIGSKMHGPVPNEKPLSAYGKEVIGSESLDTVHLKRMQVVAAPIQAEDIQKYRVVYPDKEAAHAIVLNTETGKVYLQRPIGAALLEPRNKWMQDRKVVSAAYYDNNKYVVTLDSVSIVRKFSVYDGNERTIQHSSQNMEIRALLASQNKGKTVDLKAPVLESDIRRISNDYRELGHKDVRTYEVGKTATVKKAIADFSKRMGVKGYSKLAAGAVAESAIVGGILYSGESKREDLAEVENAPKMLRLGEADAARGEK